MAKSTVDEIRARFDADVERFSNLETGQTATVDARLQMELIADAAAAVSPHAGCLLDVGCGAGNFSLMLLSRLPGMHVTLVDLSLPMLQRAEARIAPVNGGKIQAIQSDIRLLTLGEQQFDIILAAAVLHHLRTPEEWRQVFGKLVNALKPGGSFWIFDLVESQHPHIERLMRNRYGDYLKAFKGEAYREQVFAYVEAEDTPAPLMTQIDLLRECGLSQVDVLHKTCCFASFGGVKSG